MPRVGDLTDGRCVFLGFFKKVWRGIKKVGKKVWSGIKKVGKAVKKVAPIVLLAGAAFFTVGAALGVTPFWGGAVSKFVNLIGIKFGTKAGVLHGMLTGAIKQAGYGALVGAGTAAASGQDWRRGAAAGAGVGAVSGAALGAFGVGVKDPSQVRGFGRQGVAPPSPPPANQTPPPGTGPGGGAPQPDPIPPPRSTPQGGFWDRHGPWIGPTLAGVGTGALQGLGDRARAEMERETIEDRRESYEIDWDTVFDRQFYITPPGRGLFAKYLPEPQPVQELPVRAEAATPVAVSPLAAVASAEDKRPKLLRVADDVLEGKYPRIKPQEGSLAAYALG